MAILDTRCTWWNCDRRAISVVTSDVPMLLPMLRIIARDAKPGRGLQAESLGDSGDRASRESGTGRARAVDPGRPVRR